MLIDESKEFDDVFADSAGVILEKDIIDDSDFGAPELKKRVLKKLEECNERLLIAIR